LSNSLEINYEAVGKPNPGSPSVCWKKKTKMQIRS